jgi:hypothetical protein
MGQNQFQRAPALCNITWCARTLLAATFQSPSPSQSKNDGVPEGGVGWAGGSRDSKSVCPTAHGRPQAASTSRSWRVPSVVPLKSHCDLETARSVPSAMWLLCLQHHMTSLNKTLTPVACKESHRPGLLTHRFSNHGYRWVWRRSLAFLSRGATKRGGGLLSYSLPLQTPQKRSLKYTDFVDITIPQVLRDFPFSWNQPLKSADD